MTAPPAQLFLEILADRKLRPAAVQLRVAAIDTDALVKLVGTEPFTDLSARMLCVVDEQEWNRLPDAAMQALQAAGCRMIGKSAVCNVDAMGDPELPPEAAYLAGDWYLRPPPKAVSTQLASRALALQLLQLVAADADTHEIETIFRHDPSLSYHLLRLVNSLNRGGKQITSFAQAILILGRQQLRRWLNLILFAAHKEDPRSPMLTARVSVRARSMELLARAAGLDKAHQELAFMAGMFSLLGVLFGMPLDDVLKPLNIGDALAAGVLRQEGDLGRMLAIVVAAEGADATQVAAHLESLGLPETAFNEIGIAAVAWMLDVVADTTGGTRV